MRRFIEGKIIQTRIIVQKAVESVIDKLSEDSGNFVEELIKYIIGLVIGALVLAGLYALIKNVVMSAIQSKTQDLFNYTA